MHFVIERCQSEGSAMVLNPGAVLGLGNLLEDTAGDLAALQHPDHTTCSLVFFLVRTGLFSLTSR